MYMNLCWAGWGCLLLRLVLDRLLDLQTWGLHLASKELVVVV